MPKEKKPSKNLKPPKQTPDTSFASAQEIVDSFKDEMLVEMQPLIAMRLKKFDSEQNDYLRRGLVMCCLRFLKDEEKCTPGLLQVICRVLDGNLSEIGDVIPGSRVDEIKQSLPKFEDEDD